MKLSKRSISTIMDIALILSLSLSITTFLCNETLAAPFVNQIKRLLASDAAEGDCFGQSVSISGNYAIVGALKNDDISNESGSVYIFQKDQGGTNNWGQIKKITASDAAGGDYFGNSVFISGDYAIVSAPGNDGAALNAGAVYIFYKDQGGINNWGEVKKITASDAASSDSFGNSVSISGDYAIVSAPGNDGAALNAGAVYIFYKDQGGTNNWGEVKKITASDAASDDFLGYSSISISGYYAIVGAYHHWNRGSAYIFNKDQGGTNNWGEVKKITASDAADLDEFGKFVSISGNYAIVGAPGNDDAGYASGSAYIFDKDQGGTNNWGEVKKITASDAAQLDFFGYSVSINDYYAIVGAWRKDDGGDSPSPGSIFTGNAYIFYKDEGGPNNWGERTKITNSDTTDGDFFGYPVAISSNYIIIGVFDFYGRSSPSPSGSAYIYQNSVKRGDINNDGTVDLTDAILALQVLIDVSPSTTIALSGDVNSDNRIGLEEVIYAIHWLAGFYNHAPVLETIGNKEIKANQSVSFQVVGSDSDGDNLTYIAVNLPDGATFDPNTRTFSWTPTHHQVGDFYTTLRVVDIYGASDEKVVLIQVLANEPPELNPIGNKTVDENSTLTFTISATDPEGDSLTYSASDLPDGASFNPNTRTFSWAPTYSQSGIYNVIFIVTDNYDNLDSENVTITVNDKIPVFIAPEYFPLDIGYWWDFKDDNTGQIGRISVTGNQTIGGTQTKIYQYPSGYKDYYTSGSTGVKLYGSYIISYEYTGDIFFNPPILILPNNAQVGTTQVSTATYPITIYVQGYGSVTGHFNFTSTTVVLGLEDVITENSILKDCIKISFQVTQYLQETGKTIVGDTIYYWFYKGVGVVKETWSGNGATVIRSYVNGISQTY